MTRSLLTGTRACMMAMFMICSGIACGEEGLFEDLAKGLDEETVEELRKQAPGPGAADYQQCLLQCPNKALVTKAHTKAHCRRSCGASMPAGVSAVFADLALSRYDNCVRDCGPEEPSRLATCRVSCVEGSVNYASKSTRVRGRAHKRSCGKGCMQTLVSCESACGPASTRAGVQSTSHCPTNCTHEAVQCLDECAAQAKLVPVKAAAPGPSH